MKSDFAKFISAIDDLFYSKNLHPSDHSKSKIVKVFYDTFRKNAWWYHSLYGDGFTMLDALSSNNYDINFNISKNSVTMASELIPTLGKNETWNHMILPLVRTTMKGVGPGEMFLTIAHPDAVFDSEKDLVIDGKELECKKFDGGCLKGNSDSQFRISEVLCTKYGLREKKMQTSEKYYENILKLPKANIKEFWRQFYPNMEEENINILSSINISNASQVHGAVVMSEYRKIDGFNSIVLISEEDNPKIIHLTDFQDSSFIDKNVKFAPKFWRGGDTMAVGDGYVVISGKK